MQVKYCADIQYINAKEVNIFKYTSTIENKFNNSDVDTVTVMWRSLQVKLILIKYHKLS